MEILDSRGLLDELGPVPNDVVGHFGGVPLGLTLPGPYPGQWKVPQVRTEELLGDWATGLGAVVLRGHELRGLTVTPDHAEAEVHGPDGPVRLRAKCVVGCDGEHSTVRRLGGFDFPGTDATRELIRADVAGIDIPNRRFQRLERGLAIAARRPDGVTRVMLHEYGRTARPRAAGPGSAAEPTFAELAEAWRRVTGEDIGDGTPLWVNAFGDVSRQAAHYRDHRLFLAGDAAHAQMPIGGQALNLGLQDAVNLGWKLAAQVGERGPEGLLDSYHTERHAVGGRTLGNIAAQGLLLLGGAEVESARDVLAELVPHEDVRVHLAGMVSGLDVRYDVGPGSHPLLGARLPTRSWPATADRPAPWRCCVPARGLLLALSGDESRRAGLRATAAPGRPWWTRCPPMSRPAGACWETPRPSSYARTVTSRGPDPTARRISRPPCTDGSVPRRPPPRQPARRPSRLVPRPPHRQGPARSRPRPTRQRSGENTTWADSPGRQRSSQDRAGASAARPPCASRGRARSSPSTTPRTSDAADEVVASIEKDGGRAFAVGAELGVTGDVHELFLGLEQGLKERTGTTDLDILVNNAGVMGGVAPEDTTPEQFDRLVAVNAKAPFFIIQRALKIMPNGGRVINISSGLTPLREPAGDRVRDDQGRRGDARPALRQGAGPRGITVNSVAPGITRNGNPAFDIPEVVEQMAALSTFNRVGEPQDVGDVVAFLATDDARWITGAFIDASGGTLLG